MRKPILSGGCVRTCSGATLGRAALDILLASDRRPCAVATGAHSAVCNARPHGHAWLKPPRDLRRARSDQAGGGSLALPARLMEDRAHALGKAATHLGRHIRNGGVFSRIRHGSSGSHRREKAWLISRHCDAARPARSPPGCEALRHHSGTIPAPFAAGLALPLQPRRAMETVLEHPPTLTAAQRPRRVCNDQVAR
jgi:hypothetical protein